MAKRLTLTDRHAVKTWDEFKNNLLNAANIDLFESHEDKKKRIARLELNPEEWFKYYFPDYYKSEAASFHKTATKRLLKNKRWYEVRAWSRELAKSARSMFEVIYMAMIGEIKNVLLISNSWDNANRLLIPFMIHFEHNPRLINDYGIQQRPGHWEEGEFTIMRGCSFRAIGAGQSPRGTRNEAIRPDFILIDDIDTDEETRNLERIDKKWEWIESALIPTVSVSGNYRVLFNGNIIAKDCCITRAIDKADKVDIINIRNKDGQSSWPQKNSEEDIDKLLAMISSAAAQKEYFNNPLAEGEVFKDISFGKVPPLSKFKFLVVYGDPAPGENKSKQSSTKAVWLLGKKDGKLYVIKGFLDRALNAEFIDWYVALQEYVAGKATIYNYMENNKLQDPFFQQVFKPLVRKVRKEKNISLYIQGDEEKKTDKATRIEANLEPMNREGMLIFNEKEKDNPHMQRLVDQFKLFTIRLKYPADGPDAIEGGNRIINQKIRSAEPGAYIPRSTFRHKNKNRM